LKHIKERCDSIGAIPVWMFVPTLEGSYTLDEDKQLNALAKELGFYVLDLHGFYDNIPELELTLRKWDYHPNARGHELISKKMYEEIKKNESLIDRINKMKPQ
jgi:hypothetical protein